MVSLLFWKLLEIPSFISDVFVVWRIEMSSLWFSQKLIMPWGNILNRGKFAFRKNDPLLKAYLSTHCQTKEMKKKRILRCTNVIMRWIRHNLLLGYGILTVSFPPFPSSTLHSRPTSQKNFHN